MTKWVAVAVLALGCSQPAGIDPEPLPGPPDASPGGSGGNAQDGAPTGGSAGVPGAGGSTAVTAGCDTAVGPILWAVAGFGGKSADDLLPVMAYRDVFSDDVAPAGVARRVLPGVLVGEGRAAVQCGFTGAGGAPPVTFVLP